MTEQRLRVDNFDIVGITESRANCNVLHAELSIPGFDMFRKDRRYHMIGGEVIMDVNSALKTTLDEDLSNSEFDDSVWCAIRTGSKGLLVGLCYRSTSSTVESEENLLYLLEKVSLLQ